MLDGIFEREIVSKYGCIFLLWNVIKTLKSREDEALILWSVEDFLLSCSTSRRAAFVALLFMKLEICSKITSL